MSRPPFFTALLFAYLICFPSSAHLPENFADLSEDVQAVILEYAFFPEQATKIWGADYEAPSAHQLVKYLDDYHTKVNINFASGHIRVASERSKTPLKSLQQAIVNILLTPADPNAVDLFTAADMGLTGSPFLLGLVQDQQHRNIQTAAQATAYAQYLIAHKLQRHGARYWVDIPMARSYKRTSANHYAAMVQQASLHYRVPSALIFAIIETESSFNPFAVSPSGAFGLMQVMQKTAGRDVFEKIHRRGGYPDRNYLMTPEKNIDIGTAYLTILRDSYLKGIRNPQSLEYCMIAAYNGGAGNLLKTFHRDRQRALERINELSSREVYDRIVHHHPQQESRNYLKKVTAFKQNYVR